LVRTELKPAGFLALALTTAVLLTACAGPPQADGDFYTVRSGDTLYSLGRAFGQDHRDLARWNQISDRDDIRVGQVLRIRPPATVSRSAAASSEHAAPRRVAPAPAPRKSTAKPREPDPEPPEAPATGEVAGMHWMWPAQGHVVTNSGRNQKGVSIAGNSGQPVWASAGGKVTYAGRGIRGYGNMIIIKHSRTLLSVYAHNKSIMVTEGQTVNRGQQIAEMGNSDSSSVRLYFEIRGNGKPINPLPLLPKQ
jgi:lipoprotein NlpD